MPASYPFTPELGWSITRYDRFVSCKRQYFFEYYPRFETVVPPQKLAFLKSLTSVPLEVGNLVHDTIAVLLHRLRKSTAPINTDDVLAYSCNLADRALAHKPWHETYYGRVEQIDGDDLKAKVTGCLQNFFESRWYDWVLQDAVAYRDDWIIEPDDYGEIRVKGLKAYCKVDFLFPTEDGTVYILDWKTGGSNAKKHTRQMKGYVLYAKEMTDADISQVRPVVVYLSGRYVELENTFSESDLDQFAEQMAAETQEMYEYCASVEENIPKPKEDFPPQTSALCAYCNYAEICDRQTVA